MSATPFIFAEASLASELGLPQKNLRELRTAQLTRGADWQHTGNTVLYSAAGRVRLLAAVNVSDPALPVEHSAPKNSSDPVTESAAAATAPVGGAGQAATASELAGTRGQLCAVLQQRAAPPKPLGPPRHGDVRELVCIRLYPLNKRIILATLGSLEVRVRVADNRNIVLGMVIPCRLLHGDLWELARRLPRWRGKW